MSAESLRPPILIKCPRCSLAVELKIPLVLSVDYTCEGCGCCLRYSTLTHLTTVDWDPEEERST